MILTKLWLSNSSNESILLLQRDPTEHEFIVLFHLFTDSSCSEGNLTVVSDVNNSSLQLVEMCSSEGVWSPVCDNNWTLHDATVVCRDLEKQGFHSVISYKQCFSMILLYMG